MIHPDHAVSKIISGWWRDDNECQFYSPPAAGNTISTSSGREHFHGSFSRTFFNLLQVTAGGKLKYVSHRCIGCAETCTLWRKQRLRSRRLSEVSAALWRVDSWTWNAILHLITYIGLITTLAKLKTAHYLAVSADSEISNTGWKNVHVRPLENRMALNLLVWRQTTTQTL